jgi:uncharacterized coiled-coil DUF342 family protein
MTDAAEGFDALQNQIKDLETRKMELIERVKYLTRRVRYKRFEQKALEPYLEQTKGVQIAPLRKRRNMVEFRIATAAYTPRMEKELLKEVKKLDEQLAGVREVERARRKKQYVDQDIEQGEKEIVDIETALKDVREKLRVLYDDAKAARMVAKRSAVAAAAAEEDMVALGDLAMIEKKEE